MRIAWAADKGAVRDAEEAGVNAAIMGDILTTAGVTREMDRRMIDECGFTI